MDCRYSKVTGGVTVAVMSVLLAACGGGGGDSGGPAPAPSDGTNEPATRLSAGSFLTTVSRDQSGSEDNGITFLSPTGKFMTALPGSISFGTLTFSDGNISGEATDFIAQQSSWEQVNGEVSGNVETRNTATLDGTAPGFTSTINLERQQAFSDQGLTLAGMADSYTMTSEGETVATLTVNSDGELTGMDTADCVVNGQVTIPDNRVNIFEVQYTAANCTASARATAEEHNGNYSGIGTFDPEESTLEFAANNGNVALLFVGVK